MKMTMKRLQSQLQEHLSVGRQQETCHLAWIFCSNVSCFHSEFIGFLFLFLSLLFFVIHGTLCDQAKWVGTRKYCFQDTAKQSREFLLFLMICSVFQLFVFIVEFSPTKPKQYPNQLLIENAKKSEIIFSTSDSFCLIAPQFFFRKYCQPHIRMNMVGSRTKAIWKSHKYIVSLIIYAFPWVLGSDILFIIYHSKSISIFCQRTHRQWQSKERIHRGWLYKSADPDQCGS